MTSAAQVVVWYVCAREKAFVLGGVDLLTTHRGQVALCAVPRDIRHQHRWVPTEGLAYRTLIAQLLYSPAYRRRLEAGMTKTVPQAQSDQKGGPE